MVEMLDHAYLFLQMVIGLVVKIHEYPLEVNAFTVETHAYIGET